MAQKWTPHFSNGGLSDLMERGSEIGLVQASTELGDREPSPQVQAAVAQLIEKIPDASILVDKDAAGRVRITVRYPRGQ